MSTPIPFPEGTEISIGGQPVTKPWGQHPTEPFSARLLKPMPVATMIDTLTALWIGLHATNIALSHDGELADNGRRSRKFFLTYAPDTGFVLPPGALQPEELTLTSEGLAEVLAP